MLDLNKAITEKEIGNKVQESKVDSPEKVKQLEYSLFDLQDSHENLYKPPEGLLSPTVGLFPNPFTVISPIITPNSVPIPYKEPKARSSSKHKVNTSQDDLLGLLPNEKNSEVLLEFEEAVPSLHKTEKKSCILSTTLEICLDRCQVIFHLKSNLTILEVSCNFKGKSLYLDQAVEKNESVIDNIYAKILPNLFVANNELILVEPKRIFLCQGCYTVENDPVAIKVFRNFPRWEVDVEINQKVKSFELIDIKENFEEKFDWEGNIEVLVCLFKLENNEIKTNLAMKVPFIFILSGDFQLRNQQYANLVVSQVSYVSGTALFVQGNSQGKRLFPLLVDYSTLNRMNKSNIGIAEAAKLLVDSLDISNRQLRLKIPQSKHSSVDYTNGEASKRRESQVKLFLEKNLYEINSTVSSETLILTAKNLANNLEYILEVLLCDVYDFASITSNIYFEDNIIYFKTKSADLPFRQKNTSKSISVSNELSSSSNSLSNTNRVKKLREGTLKSEYSRNLLKGKSIENVNYGDRIIFRTCIYANDRMYQISMNLTDEEILNFYVRRGSEPECLTTCSIDITTLCEKTGLDRKYLVPLGSYVLRNMLIIKDADVCYFDFSKPRYTKNRAIDKIVGLLKGFVVRKKISLKLNRLIGKKKIKIESVVYTCLIYIQEDLVHLRLVKGFEVLALQLNLMKLVKDGYMANINRFFASLLELGFRIEEKNGQRHLAGLDAWRIEEKLN